MCCDVDTTVQASIIEITDIITYMKIKQKNIDFHMIYKCSEFILFVFIKNNDFMIECDKYIINIRAVHCAHIMQFYSLNISVAPVNPILAANLSLSSCHPPAPSVVYTPV